MEVAEGSAQTPGKDASPHTDGIITTESVQVPVFTLLKGSPNSPRECVTDTLKNTKKNTSELWVTIQFSIYTVIYSC
jgi:hypothetical protein